MKKPSNPIFRLRKKAGLSQEIAADRMGIRQSTWSELEKRDSIEGAKLSTLKKVAEALGVGLELLTGEKP